MLSLTLESKFEVDGMEGRDNGGRLGLLPTDEISENVGDDC